MLTVTVEDMRRDPENYLRRAEAGEPVLIVESPGSTDYKATESETTPGQRPFGLASGQFVVPDDFDEPLPAEVAQTFIS